MPLTVNGLSVSIPEGDEMTARIGDAGSVILCQMDNGSVFRIFGLLTPGHSNYYRLHGTRGAMEISRGPGYYGPGSVRVWHDHWDLKPGELSERVYHPNWPEHADLAAKAGHGGGDFWTNFHFANAIRSGEQPFLDCYRGVAMSVVGIQAWKSALEKGKPFEVPNFKKESERKKHEGDHWSPFPDDAGPGQPPPSINGFVKPPAKGLANARRIWKKIGYKGKDF